MKTKLIISGLIAGILTFGVYLSAHAFTIQDLFPWYGGQQVFGGFNDGFKSIQLAPSPSNGNCLKTDGTDNLWGSCGSGGSGGGTWSTTTPANTSYDVNYPNETDDVVVIGSNATSSAEFYFDPNSLFAKIGAQLLVTGSTTLQNFTFVNATGTNATTSNLSVSNQVDFDQLTSAIILTGSTGILAEYAGTSCTNQFVRSLSALGAATCATVGAGDVSLAALTAGTGLTAAGTYTGATARTFSVDQSFSPTWTGTHIFNDITRSTTTSATSTSLFATTASTTNLFLATGACDTLDTDSTGKVICGTDNAGSGGSGNVATSTTETAGNLAYWTSTGATPATLGKVATTTLTIGAPLTTSGTAGFLVGGTNLTIDIDDIKAADLDLTDITLNDFTNDANFLANTRQLTVAGTANQITSSAGAQDLSADRTWTLSLPSHVIFPSSFQATRSTTTHATTTNLDITSLLTFNSVTGNSWDDFCTTITGSAGLCDGDDSSAAGGVPNSKWATSTGSDITPNGGGGIILASSSTIPMLNVGLLRFAATTSTSTIATFGGAPFIMASTSSADAAGGNHALGYNALRDLRNSGDANTAFGFAALAGATSTDRNTAFGYKALTLGDITGNGNNTAIGSEALEANLGEFNTAVGTDALKANTTGDRNTCVGVDCLWQNTTGIRNVSMGVDSLVGNTSGQQNVGIGYAAGAGITTGSNNTIVGASSVTVGDVGSNNTIVGQFTAINMTGNDNTVMGKFGSRDLTSGYGNTTLGASAGDDLTSGFGNIALGARTYLPSNTDGLQLNIGNAIWGNLPATSTSFALRKDTARIGIGTTTPQWLLQLASSTSPQLTLSDSSSKTLNHWSFRNAGGLFYLATSSASTFATSSQPAFSINADGIPSFPSLGTCSGSNAIISTAGVFGCGAIAGGAASSTLLSDNNTFTGLNVFGNGTSTNWFSTTASSTNLFASVFNFGSNILSLVGDTITAGANAVIDFGAGLLEIPNAANPSLGTVAGRVAVDTTQASSSIKYYDGTAERVLHPFFDKPTIHASSTLAYDGAYGASGTTTYIMWNPSRAVTLVDIYCKTNVGTVWYEIGTGASTSTVQCTTSGAHSSTDVAFTMRADVYEALGRQASDPSRIVVTPTFRWDE